MDKWDCYFNKWKPFPKKQHKQSPEILVKEAQLLQGLLQELLSCLPNNGSLHSSIRTDRWNEMVRQLDVLVTLNSDGFDKKFQQFVTVGPKLIAKVHIFPYGVFDLDYSHMLGQAWIMRFVASFTSLVSGS